MAKLKWGVGNRDRFLSRRAIVVMLGAVAIGIFVWWCFVWRVVAPVDQWSVQEIQSIKVNVFEGRKPAAEYYELERKIFDDLISAFRPSREDSEPMKWQGLAVLEVLMKDGSSRWIEVYDADGDEIRYSIDRCYMRGGSRARLMAVLERKGKSRGQEVKGEEGQTLNTQSRPLDPSG